MPSDPNQSHDDDDAPPVRAARLGIRVGCADLPSGLRRERMFDKLDYLESSTTLADPPKLKALRQWRDGLPPNRGFGMFAPQVIAEDGFRDTEKVRRASVLLAHQVDALAPEVVVFRTPTAFAPSTANRDAMVRFLATHDLGERTIAWDPQGLWEPAQAAAQARAMGVLYAADPLSNDPLGEGPEFYASLGDGSAAYFRVTGMGRKHRVDDFALEELAEAAAAYQRAWVVFAHPSKYPDALKFRTIVKKRAAG